MATSKFHIEDCQLLILYTVGKIAIYNVSIGLEVFQTAAMIVDWFPLHLHNLEFENILRTTYGR